MIIMRLLEHEAAHKTFLSIAESLPDRPGDGVDKWYCNYDYILCRTEDMAIELAELIGYDYCGPCPSYDAIEYGYFEPESDKESGIDDDTSGWYFVRDNTFWDD